MTTVLLTHPSARQPSIRARFQELGWEVREPNLTETSTGDEMMQALRGVDGVIARVEPYSRATLESADRLRVISRVGVGYDAIDVEAATERGVVICTSVGSNHKTVADFAVTLMLMLARRLITCHENVVVRGGFERPLGIDFFGKTVGVIGTGAIGKQVIRRVQAFDCPVLGYDVVQDPDLVANGFPYVPLETLLRESDFVTLHLPYLASTYHLIGAAELALMRPSAYLVNTARGPLIDERALYQALKERRIAGAGLDVFEREPLTAENPLRALDNVLLTPHAAGSTKEAQTRSVALAMDNLILVLQGSPPRSCVNPSVLSR